MRSTENKVINLGLRRYLQEIKKMNEMFAATAEQGVFVQVAGLAGM